MFSLCDFCCSKPALVHCDADSADLCLFCDRHVHSANALSLNHTRRWICHLCGRNPASFLSSISLLLCPDCTGSEDSPIEGFSGCPSPASMASDLGLDDIYEREQRKKEVRQQLAEMARLDVDTAELRPETPPPSSADYCTISGDEEDLLWDYNPTYDSCLRKRYMEKKKTPRHFDYRYESRKVRADSRKRVKGRFVKSNEPHV